jgi:hypothetical protein
VRLLLRQLAPLPSGIYGPRRDLFPERAAFLHPEAAEAFAALERDTGGLVYSDIYRSAASSLQALATKAGVQPPGYSAHGYGIAFDLAVDASLRRLGCTYQALLDRLASHGWHCHRRDGERGREDWHFNFLGPAAAEILSHTTGEHGSWSHAAELAIVAAYPELSERMEPTEIQMDLALLDLYAGKIDGDLGPVSKRAAEAFARAWHLPAAHGTRFERTLRFVAAEVVSV